jgi:hypothetical protein
MMEAPGLCVPNNIDHITDDIVRESYEIATTYLKSLSAHLSIFFSTSQKERLIYLQLAPGHSKSK